jgi:Flp pilus assembly protein TadG
MRCRLRLRKWMKQFCRCEAGQALVETSLSTSLLLLVLLGAVDLAQVIYATIEVTNAAKAAVQYGAQNTATAADTTDIQAAASGEAANLSGRTTTVTTTGQCSDGSACTGTGGACLPTDCSGSHIETVLTANTSENYSPMIQIPGLLSTFTLRGQAVQKVLNF